MMDQGVTERAKRKPKLAVRVIEALKQRIEVGELQPGNRLPPETALVESFGVSRTVVREAITALAVDGYVEPRHGAGVFVLAREATVSPMRLGTPASLLDCMELRIAVEVEAAALAAVRRSSAQEAAIRDAHKSLHRLAEDERDARTRADIDFHLAVANATNNTCFIDAAEMLAHRVMPLLRPNGETLDPINGAAEPAQDEGGRLRAIVEEHAAILEAISAADPSAARSAMRLHLSNAERRLQRTKALGLAS